MSGKKVVQHRELGINHVEEEPLKKYIVVAVAYIHVLLTAGVVFGWAALEPFYMDLSEHSRGITFTVAASCNYLSNLFYGPFLDAFGCRACSGLSCVMMLIGALGMLVAQMPDIVGEFRSSIIYFSFGLLGFAGPGVQMPTLRCELLFPKQASLITSINASLFDASTMVFLLFRLLALGLDLDVFALFSGYAIAMVFLLISGLACFGTLDTAHCRVVETSKASETKETSVGDEEAQKNVPQKDAGAHGAAMSFKHALCSFRFIYLSIFCAISILRLNFVVMTLNTQLAIDFTDDASAGTQLSLIFSILLPLGGLAAPATAYLLANHHRNAYRISLLLSLGYGLGLAVTSVVPQLIAYIIISVSRQLTYSIVFAFTMRLFGQKHLGKLLGTINAVVFTVGLLQYPIATMVGSAWLPSWPVADVFMTALSVPLLFSNGGL